MTDRQHRVNERLKRMGYAQGCRIRIYGREFELISDPITLEDHLIFVDAVERSSGLVQRVRIPLPVVRMVQQDMLVA